MKGNLEIAVRMAYSIWIFQGSNIFFIFCFELISCGNHYETMALLASESPWDCRGLGRGCSCLLLHYCITCQPNWAFSPHPGADVGLGSFPLSEEEIQPHITPRSSPISDLLYSSLPVLRKVRTENRGPGLHQLCPFFILIFCGIQLRNWGITICNSTHKVHTGRWKAVRLTLLEVWGETEVKSLSEELSVEGCAHL